MRKMLAENCVSKKKNSKMVQNLDSKLLKQCSYEDLLVPDESQKNLELL